MSVVEPQEKAKDEEIVPVETNAAEEATIIDKLKSRIRAFLEMYDFPILIVIFIGIAKAYPPLGAHYLRPDITASWLAVALIFFFMGITLKSEELKKSFKRVRFNSFVQIFSFFVVSAIVFGTSRLLVKIGVVTRVLADGMVICSCLPVAINAVVILTLTAKGDEAAAVFHAVVGNMVGIFLSPLLILGYLGKSGNVSLGTVFYQLTLRVIVPVIVGQILRFSFQQVIDFSKKYKFYLSKAQQYLLVFTVYTVFCTTFAKGNSAGIGNVFLMILFQFLLMLSVKSLAWIGLGQFFPDEPKLRVAGLFACTQKTIALGVPLIASIYQHNPNKGLYTLPILVWHPMQLVVGSLLTSRLIRFVESESERLGINYDEPVKNTTIETEEGAEDANDVENIAAEAELPKNQDQALQSNVGNVDDEVTTAPKSF